MAQPLSSTAADDLHLNPLMLASINEADLMEGLKILYVSPTKTSLANFTATTNSAYLAPYVEHLIFLPRALDSAGGDDMDDMYDDHEAENDARLALEEVHEDRQIYDDLKAEYQFGSDDLNDEDEQRTLEHGVIIQLQAGLINLPNLTAISIHNFITRPGLNASPLWFSDSLQEEYMLKGHAGVRDSAAGISVTDFFRNVYVGAQRVDTIFRALAPYLSSRKMLAKIKTLTLGDGQFNQLHGAQLEDFDFEDVADLFTNLTKLTISATSFVLNSTVCEFWQNTIRCARNVQELTIYEDSSNRPDEYANVTDIALCKGKFAFLRKLSLVDNKKELGYIDSDAFTIFAVGHRAALREIFLSGILPSDGTEREDIRATMADTLTDIKNEMDLTNFEMHVYRRDEHEPFQDCTNGGWDACNRDCERYILKNSVTSRGFLGQSAQELNVFHHSRGWDFGNYVMGPESAIGNLLQQVGRQVEERGVSVAEGGDIVASVEDRLLGGLHQIKQEEAADGRYIEAESEYESAIESDWEDPEGYEEEDEEMDWYSDVEGTIY